MDPAVMRVINPCWMEDPERWIWQRPDGRPQGFGATWRENVGLTNLQWLALGMNEPPVRYDANQNALYMWAILQGKVLQDRAEVLTLSQFALVDPSCPQAAELIQRAIRRTHAIH